MKSIKILLASIVAGSCVWFGTANAQATDVECNGCVDSTDIADSGVRGRNIANGHIVSRHIKNGNLITMKFADGAITTEKIADGAVTAAKIDVAQVQQRVSGSCDVGSFVASVAEDGSVTCGTGTTADGDYNTRYGESALASVIPAGYGNNDIGYYALFSNTDGQENVANGAGALYSNTVGVYNTGIGYQALVANDDGSVNTAVGNWALYSNVSGSYNVAIGGEAGFDTTGDDNIIIGESNYGVAGESGTIRLGSGWQTRAFIAGIRGVTTSVANAVNVVIDSNGQLGTINSSVRYKEDIQDMGDASDKLLQLRPVTYRYKESYENGEKPLDYGLIAEEVAEVFPELVVYNGEGQPETVKYRLLSTLLLNELQKEHQINQDQSVEMAELKSQVAELTLLVTQLANSGELDQETLVANAGAD